MTEVSYVYGQYEGDGDDDYETHHTIFQVPYNERPPHREDGVVEWGWMPDASADVVGDFEYEDDARFALKLLKADPDNASDLCDQILLIRKKWDECYTDRVLVWREFGMMICLNQMSISTSCHPNQR
jgi:hypothetical protein